MIKYLRIPDEVYTVLKYYTQCPILPTPRLRKEGWGEWICVTVQNVSNFFSFSLGRPVFRNTVKKQLPHIIHQPLTSLLCFNCPHVYYITLPPCLPNGEFPTD